MYYDKEKHLLEYLIQCKEEYDRNINKFEKFKTKLGTIVIETGKIEFTDEIKTALDDIKFDIDHNLNEFNKTKSELLSSIENINL
jgi:hypothetical protein